MATSDKWPLFVKSIDGIKEYKDKHFISKLFVEVIAEVGHENVNVWFTIINLFLEVIYRLTV